MNQRARVGRPQAPRRLAARGTTVKALRPLGRRPESVRAAVAKSREARLRAVEGRLVGHLIYLRRHDPDGHAALVGMLRRVIAHETRRGR